MTDAFMEERSPLVAIRSANVNRDESQSVSSGLSPSKPIKPILPRARLSFDNSNASLSIQDDRIGLIPIAKTSMPPPNAINHDHVIYCRRSVALLLGRARAIGQEEEDEALQSQETREAVGGIPIIRIALPNTARHVSRDHCIIYHTPFGGSSWAVKILGQNGLIVDGKRHRAGSILRVISGQTLIDFFGGVCALFLGDGIPAKQSDIHTNGKMLNGRSPSKKLAIARVSLGQKGDELRNAAAQIVEVQRKYIGNMQKRPVGAPLSPPTSSPAPFDASSSPSLARSVFGKRQSIIPSSSPNKANEDIEEDNEEEEDDNDEMLNSSRATSPTLQRRANKSVADDSGVLMCEIDDNQHTPIESEDEASQALQITSKQSAKMHKRTINLVKHTKSSKSPNSTPQRSGRDLKRVKFNKDSRAGTPTATPTATNKTSVSSASALHPTRMQAIQTHFRALVGILAESYDLQGLLAGAIVFHRTATISATEAVRSVLSSNPGLMRGEVGPDGGENVKVERGSILSGWTYDNLIENNLIKTEEADKERVEIWQRKAWRERLEDCLMEGECFGIIQRAGKDASGNPLECWYYYDKEHDSDSQRAANLGAFVKPMRAALKTHKPIFWRKSAYGTTSDEVKALQMQEGQQQQQQQSQQLTPFTSSDLIGGASESQWGSSGSTLNAALLTSQQPTKNEQKTIDNIRQQSVKRVWEETQFEENEQTWDKEGDLDFEISNGRRIKRKK